MPKPKREESDAESNWQVEILGEVKVGDKATWKAQRLVSPDGSVLFGLAKFIKKANGETTITRQRLNVAQDEAPQTFKALASLLAILASPSGKASKTTTTVPFTKERLEKPTKGMHSFSDGVFTFRYGNRKTGVLKYAFKPGTKSNPAGRISANGKSKEVTSITEAVAFCKRRLQEKQA